MVTNLVEVSLPSRNDSVQQGKMLKMISYTRWTNPGKPEGMMKRAELFYRAVLAA